MAKKELEILDIWKSPNGNLFIKVSHEYSIALGRKKNLEPCVRDLETSQYVKTNPNVRAKKVGRLVFD